MKTAVFLGAGASAADGAPLQTDLFREYFKSTQNVIDVDRIHSMQSTLTNFFSNMFGIDIRSDNLENILFPTFEEVLGILDLAEIRNENFRYYRIPNYEAETQYDIRIIRVNLIILMASIIKEKLINSTGAHRMLIRNLSIADKLKDTVFVSTNYDILIDNSLIEEARNSGINYGVDFVNKQDLVRNQRPKKTGVKLFKLHGSLNWLYCSTCNTLRLTPFEKSFSEFVSTCNECSSFYSPIIIPPTYFKNMSNVFISQVWNNAENALKNVDNIIFCGYSFPDADIHIKYLLKRIEKNRSNLPPEIKVFNFHEGKSPEMKTAEKDRYKRFFGAKVIYEDISFEDFSENPVPYL